MKLKELLPIISNDQVINVLPNPKTRPHYWVDDVTTEDVNHLLDRNIERVWVDGLDVISEDEEPAFNIQLEENTIYAE